MGPHSAIREGIVANYQTRPDRGKQSCQLADLPRRAVGKALEYAALNPHLGTVDTGCQVQLWHLQCTVATTDLLLETSIHESGRPTETLKAPVPPKWWRNLGRRFWLQCASEQQRPPGCWPSKSVQPARLWRAAIPPEPRAACLLEGGRPGRRFGL